MIKLKLMADYYCFPLWEDSCYSLENIDPNSLPISKELKKNLLDWSDQYDNILNEDDPRKSGFKNSEQEKEFIQKGHKLAESLSNELGKNYEIIYHSKY